MEDLKQQMQELVTTHPVVLFMKGTKNFPTCGFSGRAAQILKARSEERRVGKECRRLCRSRWSPYH
jgi:monothiol glutaredoxin